MRADAVMHEPILDHRVGESVYRYWQALTRSVNLACCFSGCAWYGAGQPTEAKMVPAPQVFGVHGLCVVHPGPSRNATI